MRQIDYSMAYIIASRSCPMKCTFCFHPSGDRYRKRSIDDIFKEIDYLVDTYHPKALTISDELFAPNRARVIDFCKRIASYDIEWTVQLRVCDVDEEMLRLMHAAGCSTISYGIESADDRVLTSMAKKITRAQIDDALRMSYEIGIDIQGGLIFGDAAETPDTVATSLKWYDEHVHYGLELNMINVFPGTALYKNALVTGVIEDPVAFLKDGCPLINVSRLTDREYRDLASHLYERNMRAKYEPAEFRVHDIDEDGQCAVTMVCNKCGTPVSVASDLLHISRQLCAKCRQRHYLDPFKTLNLPIVLSENDFLHDERIALWGAGELCIKLLDAYPELHSDRFIVVDSSKSRQGYSVCGKTIHPVSCLEELGIRSVLVTVVRRKEQILEQLAAYPGVSRIYLPRVVRLHTDRATLHLDRVEGGTELQAA
jgi:anaerobic magnesium-protoporphyrin IX monomethyl ester cyclase